MDIVLALVVGLIVLAGVGALIVLPIVAIVRTARIRELLHRVERLEREMHYLRSAAAPAAPAEQPVTVELVEEVPRRPPARQPAEEVPVALPVEPAAAPPRRAAAFPAPSAAPPSPFAGVEAWIGVRGLGWVAVVLLLFATAFFLQQAFQHDLIGEVGRVALGLAAGAGLCVAGYRYHTRGWRVFAQMLTAAGIVLLYLSTFASFGYYHLLPQTHAAGFLIALVVEAAALAILYEAPAIAIMAVVGGLLAPVLLHTDRDQYPVLFTYLAVLNAGVVVLTRLRPSWPAVGSIALAGTQALFWGWFVLNYHPEKLAAALVFQVVLFLLHLGGGVLIHVHGARRASIEDLCRLAANGFLFGMAAYGLLETQHPRWLGTFALILALAYTVLAWAVQTWRPDDGRQLLVLVATAMAFIAAAFPLETDTFWAPVGWAAQGLALWWFGVRTRALELRVMAVTLSGLAVVGVLTASVHAHAGPFVPLLNRYALPALAVCACLLAAPALARRLAAALPPLGLAAGLAGVALLWIVLSVEAGTYFIELANRDGMAAATARPPQQEALYEHAENLRRTGLAAVSVVWAAYAAALLAVGFRLRTRPLRWVALGLFGLTLGKVVLLDTAHLRELYRAAVFLVLALMMAAGAWGYQKVARRAALSGKSEEAPREMV